METAEFQVVGTLLQFPQSIRYLTDLLPEHFSNKALSEIYSATLEKIQNGETFTPVMIGMLFPQYSQIFAHALSYSSILDLRGISSSIIDGSIRRKLEACAKKQLRLLKEGKSGEEVKAVALEVLESTAYQSSAFVDANQLTEELLNDLNSNKQPYSTGIKAMDTCMEGGMYPGLTYGIIARKKMGKTAMAGTMAYNMGMMGTNVLYIAAEMGAKQIFQRMLARHFDIFPSAFRRGNTGYDDTKDRLHETLGKLPPTLKFVNAPGITFPRLKQLYVASKLKYGTEVCIIDYWQLIGGAGKMGQTQHLDDVAQWIADAGRAHDVANLVLGQTNREGLARFGDGLAMACDQLYDLKFPGDMEKSSYRWMDMKDSRYTKYRNVTRVCDDSPADNENHCVLYLNERGPYFEEV